MSDAHDPGAADAAYAYHPMAWAAGGLALVVIGALLHAIEATYVGLVVLAVGAVAAGVGVIGAGVLIGIRRADYERLRAPANRATNRRY